MTTTDEWLNTAEDAARHYGVPLRRLNLAVEAGELQAYRLGEASAAVKRTVSRLRLAYW